MGPVLLSSAEGVERARKRYREDEWARELVESLTREARDLESEPLPRFETEWWDEASTKPWAEIYPQIAQHTYFAVVQPCIKARNTAIAYAVTQDESLSSTVQRVLLHYAGYDFFAEHPDVGMNWSIWCLSLLQAYDLVRNTVCPDGRSKIDSFFDSALAAVRKNDEWWLRDNMGGLFNNHFAWHKLFIGSCGIFYNRPDMIDYAIEGNQGFRELIENGIRDDGLWFESSLNYHFAALVPLVEMASELSNSGSQIDLWNRTFANGRRLRDLVAGPIGILFPDETLPNIGDCYARRSRIGSHSVYSIAYDTYQSLDMAWVMKAQANPPAQALFLKHLPPEQVSPLGMKTRNWPEHGYVFLRTEEETDYWRGSGFSAFVSYELDSIHSHRDKFDLMVFGRGKHLAVDAEAASTSKHAFSSRIMRELNRSTVCHNTVMVDGRDHNPIGEKLDLVDFVDGPDVKLTTIADHAGRVCPGVAMMRTVAVTRDYVLDVFQVSSEAEHTYDYLFHTYSDTPDLDMEGVWEAVTLPDAAPWTWLREARAYVKDGDWQADAKQDDIRARLSAVGEPGTQVITCRFPGKDDFSAAPTPMLIARRSAKRTVFITLLQAEQDRIPNVLIESKEDRHGLLRVWATIGNDKRCFSVRLLK